MAKLLQPSRPGPASLLVLGSALIALGGCRARQRSEAGEAYRRELRAHQALFAEFQQRYPGLERQLAGARERAPGEVTRIVDRHMLPLLDRLSHGYTSMIRSGRSYVALLPSSFKAREALGRQLDAFEEQKRLMEQIRRTYHDEAVIFREGRPDRVALEEVFARRGAAAQRMRGSERD